MSPHSESRSADRFPGVGDRSAAEQKGRDRLPFLLRPSHANQLKSFDVDINDNQIIMIKIPKKDLSTRLKLLEIGVEDLVSGAAETYSWANFPYLGTGG